MREKGERVRVLHDGMECEPPKTFWTLKILLTIVHFSHFVKSVIWPNNHKISLKQKCFSGVIIIMKFSYQGRVLIWFSGRLIFSTVEKSWPLEKLNKSLWHIFNCNYGTSELGGIFALTKLFWFHSQITDFIKWMECIVEWSIYLQGPEVLEWPKPHSKLPKTRCMV